MYYLIVLISSVINILILMLSFSCYSSLIQICKILPIISVFFKESTFGDIHKTIFLIIFYSIIFYIYLYF